jgi:drug/metabolite transporter (DMT)-like permease
MTPRSASGALHIGALLFGLSGVLGKLASASAAVIVFGRGLLAVLALMLFARLVRSSGWPRLQLADRARLLLAGVLLAIHWVSFFIAVKVSGVAIATLGFASFPAFTVLLEGLLFREQIRGNELMPVVLVTVGLVLVTGHFDLHSEATTGLLWAVFSGLTFSLLSLVNRVNAPRVAPVQAALWQNLIVALCLLPSAAPQLADVSWLDWAWIALLGIFCTALAHSLFVASTQRGCGICTGAGLRHRLRLAAVRRGSHCKDAAGWRADSGSHPDFGVDEQAFG